jgi:hypothetical protein
MNLPKLDNPTSYAGLYVFVHAGATTVGFTAAEVAVLLDSEKYRDGKVYKIRRVEPDGRMELVGVPADRFQLEAGMFFCSQTVEQARADFDSLVGLAKATPFPCRAKIQRATLPGAGYPHVVALIYPAEFDDDVAARLLEAGYAGGQLVDAGASHVADYYFRATVIDREQVWGVLDNTDRRPEDIFAAVGRPTARMAV